MASIWSGALKIYLSDLVYGTVNLEFMSNPHFWAHGLAKLLANNELATTILDRRPTNWSLFEYANTQIGDQGVMGLIPGLPSSLNPHLHGYYKDLTDGIIHDVGSGTGRYTPIAWQLVIGGPTELPLIPGPYGVRRLRAEVSDGYACLRFESSGAFEASWRQGAEGSSGQWTQDLPDTIQGTSIFLVTTADPSATFQFIVEDVGDNEECEEEEEPTPTPEGCFECPPSAYYKNDPPFRLR